MQKTRAYINTQCEVHREITEIEEAKKRKTGGDGGRGVPRRVR